MNFAKKKGQASVIIVIILLVTIAFIWCNSLFSIPESIQESKRITQAVKPILEPITGEGNVTNHLVRKLAHLVEFGVLGCELMLLAVVRKQDGIQSILQCLFFGMTVAVIDETIQIFSHRGAQVQDIWLDFSGVVAGVFFILLIRSIVAVVRRN